MKRAVLTWLWLMSRRVWRDNLKVDPKSAEVWGRIADRLEAALQRT